MNEWLKYGLIAIGGMVVGAGLLYVGFWVWIVHDFSKWW